MTETNPTESPVAFKAEIRQLLDILIHSLYSEPDVFLRELLSNASDALNRVRFEMLTNADVHDSDAELAIWLVADQEAGTVTISDSGIGMTADELSNNLGTIARSGAKDFVDAAEENLENLSDIIGQFGVGFYSAFMVAESVTVISRAHHKDAEAAQWRSSGDETFTISPAEREARGTDIIIKLKEDAKSYSEAYKIREIIRTHSDYVAFPIYLGDEEDQINRQTALWRQPPASVEDDEYTEFHRHLTLDMEPPLAHSHIVTDAPLQLYALLFLPGTTERGILSVRKEDGLKLYSRKVLIEEYHKELLPEHFRFVQGVVDSEDIPLNVSREMVQSSTMMTRLKTILTGRVFKMLKDMAGDTENPDRYINFWDRFGTFIKEGVATDTGSRDKLFPYLRFRSTSHPDTWSSLDDYIGRVEGENKKIYYILGDDDRSVVRSPHLDYFNEKGIEVLLLTETIDSFMLMGLPAYEGFDFENVASADLDLPEAETDEAETEQPEALEEETFAGLVERFKAQLGERVGDVRSTERLSGSIARLVDPEGTLGQEMQRVYRMMERDYEAPNKILELNPRHATLANLAERPEDDALANAIIEQIYESALLIEGLHPDPASMIGRIETLMAAALESEVSSE